MSNLQNNLMANQARDFPNSLIINETQDFPAGLTPELCALEWDEFIAIPSPAPQGGTLWVVGPLLADTDILTAPLYITPEIGK